LVRERTHAKNRLHKLLRYHLPGRRIVLGRSLSKAALVVLSQFSSPQENMDGPVEQLAPSAPAYAIGWAQPWRRRCSVWPLRRFATEAHFTGYCELYPIVWESGEGKCLCSTSYKGNRMLKMTMLVASVAPRHYNPAIVISYERMHWRGKSKKAANGTIVRKLTELVFTLLRCEEPSST
jgi:hypothetical protein